MQTPLIIEVLLSKVLVSQDEKVKYVFPLNNASDVRLTSVNYSRKIAEVCDKCVNLRLEGALLEEVRDVLETAGTEIAELLFDGQATKFKNMLQTYSEADILIMGINDVWIPWELIFLSYLINGSHEYNRNPNFYRVRHDKRQALRIEGRPKVGFISHKEAPFKDQEFSHIVSLNGRGKIDRELRPSFSRESGGKEDFLKWLRELDIIHIAGLIIPIRYLEKSMILVDENFWIRQDDFNRVEFMGAPLAILNARDSYFRNPVHIGEYADTLRKKGVAGVIASEFPLPCIVAKTFPEIFYQHLFAGKDVYEALYRAKIHFLEEYGNPFAVLYAPFFNFEPPRDLHNQSEEEELDLRKRKGAKLMSFKPAKSNSVTWLHLSDFHFREREPWNVKVVLEKLLEDIENRAERINHSLEQVDMIFITGDISFSARPEQYKLAVEFLRKLRGAIKGFRKTRLFIVPGNHDVNRSNIEPHTEKTLLQDRDAVSRIYYHEELRTAFLHRFQDYRQFISAEYSHIELGDNNFYYIKNRDVNGNSIYIAGLNSAWASSEKDKEGNLILGDAQVREALEEIPDKSDTIRIALYHHPFDWLQKFDRDDCKPQCLKKFDFILHGHLHETGITSLTGPGHQAMVIGAGACYLGRDMPNAYNFVRLDLDSREGTIFFREYSDSDGGHWTKDTRTYAAAPDGEFDFDLPNQF